MSVGSMVGKVALGSLGALGATTVAGVYALKQPKTREGEHNKNQLGTVFGLGSLATLTYAAKKTANSKVASQIFQTTGSGIEKAMKYVGVKAPKIVQKINSSSAGSKILGLFSKVAGKVVGFVKNNKVLSTVAQKAGAALEKFATASTKQKGKYALIAVGAGLLATAAAKLITGHFKKSGAIDYKYDELYKDYQNMVATRPIMNARTGEPISFEDFCKYSQTMLK